MTVVDLAAAPGRKVVERFTARGVAIELGFLFVLASNAAVAQPEARVLFAGAPDLSEAAPNAVHPLACFDPRKPKKHRFAKGEACLSLLPRRSVLVGEQTTVRTAERARLSCDKPVVGLKVSGRPDPLVEWPSYTVRSTSRRDATVVELDALAAHLGRPRGALTSARVVEIDVDHDGRAERFLAADVDRKPDESGGFGVLALFRGDAIVVLERAKGESLAIEHVIDLDGDGRLELIIGWSYWEAGGYVAVLQLVGDKLVLLSTADYCSPC